MDLTGKIQVLFLLFQVFSTSTSRMCRFEIESLSSKWIRKPCVFFFDDPIKAKFIGSEYQLRDDSATKEAFQAIEANFNKFVKSPLTLWNDSCDCNKVPCLNAKQLNNLFAYSMEQARREAIVRFSFFPGLCCSLQQVLEEIVNRLQAKEVDKLMKITTTEANIHMHSRMAYFSYGLQQTEWCKTFKVKCDNFIHRIAEGCAGERRERRNIGFKTTTTCQSSLCFQDDGVVSSVPTANIGEASQVQLHVLASTSKQQLISTETSSFVAHLNPDKKEPVVLATTTGTENSREKTVQTLAWSSNIYTSSTPFPSHPWKSSITQQGSSSFSGELSPSPSMSSYMTQPMASERGIIVNEGGESPAASDAKLMTVTILNATMESAPRISKEFPFVPFSAMTRLVEETKTSTGSADDVGESLVISAESTSHLLRGESVSVETYSSQSSLTVYFSLTSSSILTSNSSGTFTSVYLSDVQVRLSLTRPPPPPTSSSSSSSSPSSSSSSSPLSPPHLPSSSLHPFLLSSSLVSLSSSSSSSLSPFSPPFLPSSSLHPFLLSSSLASLSSSSKLMTAALTTFPSAVLSSPSLLLSSMTANTTVSPLFSTPHSLLPTTPPLSSLSLSLGRKSLSSTQVILSNHTFLESIISSRTLQTFVFSSKPSPTSPTFTETFLVKLEGNCSLTTYKESFKLTFIATLANLLRLSRSDVIVHDVICGSVDVTFTIRNTRDRNLTKELWELINNVSFVIKYNGKVFTAFDLKIVSKPAATVTTFPTSVFTPTEKSKQERKKLLFIIFVLFAAIFAALFVFFLVIFLSRFCACCQKSRKLRAHKNVRLLAHDFELNRFALRRNQCLDTNFYGEITTLEQTHPKDIEIVEEDIDEYYEDEFAVGHQGDTNTSLLNSTGNHRNRNTLVFDDEDSCSSVLFY